MLAMWTVLLPGTVGPRTVGPTGRFAGSFTGTETETETPKGRSDSRWWDRNRQVIAYLDQGKSIREIAEVVGVGPRQIRNILERLSDLRTRELVATE